ncbi:MAG: TIGR01777 family oxidoreductase [bacterium]|nr:TIGR01777 family oxidoreductase [bacterium]
MKQIAIAGSNGLIGSALSSYLIQQKHSVKRIVRFPSQHPDEIFLTPESNSKEIEKLKGIHCIINLAGENIANKRWTAKQKKIILESRVQTARTIVKAMQTINEPLPLLISASAIGYYGHRPNEVVDEFSPKGNGFLADVCEAWENEIRKAENKVSRIVIVRIGVVFSLKGGALPKLIKPIQYGIGGWFGEGKQVWSWITLNDLIQVIQTIMENDKIQGVVNAVTPYPITNQALVKEIASVFHRPAIFSIPKFIMKIMLGEMADALLFDSCNVKPKRLLEHQFQWHHPTISDAMKFFFENREIGKDKSMDVYSF